MLFLNERAIRQVVTLNQVMDKVEDTYRIFASGKFMMPHRPVIERGADTLLYMPCFADGCFGTKILTLFPDNPKKGKPFIDGLMMLHDDETGETLALLDAKFLTALRTGAVGGVGVRCFAPLESRSVGVIGAGKQGLFQLRYACEARDIERVNVYDAFVKEPTAFVEALRRELGDRKPEITVCESSEQLARDSDIIITTTTSDKPVIPDKPELFEGKCVIAIGSYKPNFREIPNAIWQKTEHVYTELPFACEESGDLSQPLGDGTITMDRVRYIGDLLTADCRPKPPEKGTSSYFKSVGMGLMDLCVTKLIYEQAVKKGLGQEIEM